MDVSAHANATSTKPLPIDKPPLSFFFTPFQNVAWEYLRGPAKVSWHVVTTTSYLLWVARVIIIYGKGYPGTSIVIVTDLLYGCVHINKHAILLSMLNPVWSILRQSVLRYRQDLLLKNRIPGNVVVVGAVWLYHWEDKDWLMFSEFHVGSCPEPPTCDHLFFVHVSLSIVPHLEQHQPFLSFHRILIGPLCQFPGTPEGCLEHAPIVS